MLAGGPSHEDGAAGVVSELRRCCHARSPLSCCGVHVTGHPRSSWCATVRHRAPPFAICPFACALVREPEGADVCFDPVPALEVRSAGAPLNTSMTAAFIRNSFRLRQLARLLPPMPRSLVLESHSQHRCAPWRPHPPFAHIWQRGRGDEGCVMYLCTASVVYERGLEESVLCRHGYRLGARISAQLVEDRMDVQGNCTLGDEKLVAMALLERPCTTACGSTRVTGHSWRFDRR